MRLIRLKHTNGLGNPSTLRGIGKINTSSGYYYNSVNSNYCRKRTLSLLNNLFYL